MIRAMGGNIKVESKPGEGSNFIVNIPIGKSADRSESQASIVGDPSEIIMSAVMILDMSLGVVSYCAGQTPEGIR